MSSNGSKIEDVLKKGAVLSEGNYDALLSDNLLNSLKEWDKDCSKSLHENLSTTSQQIGGLNLQQMNGGKDKKK